ncbi:MAG: helix-turn-helix domain-containing protein [Acidobacteriota bacterium]
MDHLKGTEKSSVLTLKEVYAALRVGRVTALRLVQSGKLPAFRAGRDWRVRRADLDSFMRPALATNQIPKGGPHGAFRQNRNAR